MKLAEADIVSQIAAKAEKCAKMPDIGDAASAVPELDEPPVSTRSAATEASGQPSRWRFRRHQKCRTAFSLAGWATKSMPWQRQRKPPPSLQAPTRSPAWAWSARVGSAYDLSRDTSKPSPSGQRAGTATGFQKECRHAGDDRMGVPLATGKAVLKWKISSAKPRRKIR